MATFTGTGAQNALYVDYLQLNGPVSNNFANLLAISPNMTVYFANSNVRVETLDGALNGRLRWVREFAGPNSSVDVLVNGVTIKVNAALVSSRTIDSDDDGIANFFDPSPFDGVMMQPVTFTGGHANISWGAASQTVYTVQYTTTLTPPTWQFLLTYTNSAATNGIISVQDPTPGTGRYYRVSYTP